MQKFKAKIRISDIRAIWSSWAPEFNTNSDKMIEFEVYDAVPVAVADPVQVLADKLYYDLGARAGTDKSVKDMAQYLIDEGWINPERLK